MIRNSFLTLTALVLACCTGAASAADSPDELASKTFALFSQKCFGCHSPAAKKVKKFGYIDDFAKLRGNSKLLVPGKPVESAIFTSIEEGEMPPDDSDIAQLNEQEKELVRLWIEAGAPSGKTVAMATTSTSTTGPTVAAGAGGGESKTPPSLGKRVGRFIGKLHPLVAHFPIAVLMTAALAELLFFRYRSHLLLGVVRFCTVFGALGALAAAGLGWINANFHTQSELLDNHRVIGLIAAGLCVPIALFCEWGARRAHRRGDELWRGGSRMVFRCALALTVALIGMAAHMGGALVYGEDYFKF